MMHLDVRSLKCNGCGKEYTLTKEISRLTNEFELVAEYSYVIKYDPLRLSREADDDFNALLRRVKREYKGYKIVINEEDVGYGVKKIIKVIREIHYPSTFVEGDGSVIVFCADCVSREVANVNIKGRVGRERYLKICRRKHGLIRIANAKYLK